MMLFEPCFPVLLGFKRNDWEIFCIRHASFILPTRPLPRPRNGPSGFRLKTPLDLAMERTPALLQTLSTRYGRLRLRLISLVGQVEVCSSMDE
jgi:hypothetical protein